MLRMFFYKDGVQNNYITDYMYNCRNKNMCPLNRTYKTEEVVYKEEVEDEEGQN